MVKCLYFILSHCGVIFISHRELAKFLNDEQFVLPADVGPVPIRSTIQLIDPNRHALKVVCVVNQQVINSSSLLFAQVCHGFVALLSLQ